PFVAPPPTCSRSPKIPFAMSADALQYPGSRSGQHTFGSDYSIQQLRQNPAEAIDKYPSIWYYRVQKQAHERLACPTHERCKNPRKRFKKARIEFVFFLRVYTRIVNQFVPWDIWK
ncbi:MAG: hypothetical protein QM271_07340, partial [Bacillota bacterium]|nr:hypothetical protein [Bacillota bacterium]